MANQIADSLYVSGQYLDRSVFVRSIQELLSKTDTDSFFLGISIHMPEAFSGSAGIPYPLDFWSIPYGNDVRWCIKTSPALDKKEDLDNFKAFIVEFYNLTKYSPLAEGTTVTAEGKTYVVNVTENGDVTYVETEETLDNTINEIVDSAIEKVTSGASSSFDTLKEIEDWIVAHSGDTTIIDDIKELSAASHTHINREILDAITSEKVSQWDTSKDKAVEEATEYVDEAVSGLTSVIDSLKEQIESLSDGIYWEVGEDGGKIE